MHRLRSLSLICFSLALCLVLSTNLVSAQQDETYVVQPGDTLTNIANQFGISLDVLLIRNNLSSPNDIRYGTTLTIPQSDFTSTMVHVVQPGERLTDLAIRYDTTVEELVMLNRIGNANLLQRGQEVMVPSRTITVNVMPPVHPPSAPTPSPAPSPTPTTYIVHPGDTLASIAAHFGTTVAHLAAVNNIAHPDLIFVGQQLVIPASGGPVVVHPPQPPVVHPPQQPPLVHTPSNRVYIVQAGDYLERIAHLFGVTVEGIRQLNGIVDNRKIFPGDRLLIPPATHPVQPVHPRRVVDGHYIVQPGDTLLHIARDFGVDVYNLARANGIFNLNSIFAGQALTIPAQG